MNNSYNNNSHYNFIFKNQSNHCDRNMILKWISLLLLNYGVNFYDQIIM